MPLVFAAHAGSVLALTGTPVNVLVADAARDAGAGEFGFLEFALVGVPPTCPPWPASWSRSTTTSTARGRSTPASAGSPRS
jgi:di/tricarboxylate transporter